MLLPPVYTQESQQELRNAWSKEAPAAMAVYHAELLLKAEALVQFIESNVGTTEDYPLTLYAETPETMAEFDKQLSQMRSMVDFMREI